MTSPALRLGAPAVVALFGVVAAALSERDPSVVLAAGGALAAVLAALVLLRARGWGLAVGLVAAAAAFAGFGTAQSSNVGWFGVCAVAGWGGYFLGGRLAGVVIAACTLGFVAQWLAQSDEPGWGAWIAGTIFAGVACVLDQRQRELLDRLRDAQAGLAERAAAEERNRIAHDLHDVIGHALTVSLLHITSARLALAEDPDEAGDALAEAERLAQQSLADVRAVVGLMKDPSAPAPLPGVDQVDELVESFRRAGSPVRLEVDGDLSALTATEGLTVYRILQEALTNAARHAPGAPVTVRIAVADGRATVVVDSEGAPGRPSADGAGLTSMRERAEAMGGTLTAGPWGSGWRVEAVL